MSLAVTEPITRSAGVTEVSHRASVPTGPTLVGPAKREKEHRNESNRAAQPSFLCSFSRLGAARSAAAGRTRTDACTAPFLRSSVVKIVDPMFTSAALLRS